MKIFLSSSFALLGRLLFLGSLVFFALPLTGCGTVETLLPQKGERVEALELDPTEEHALVEVDGARWVLFNLDFGGEARRIIRGAVDGAAAVGQTVGQKMVEVSPEEKIMQMFQAAREAARIEQARGAVLHATPPLPTRLSP